MRILIMEYSGKVREAFRAKGHDAWSCNYEPAEDASPYHLQMDMTKVMRSNDWGHWDMFGLHPDCTFLTVAGIHWNNRGRGWVHTEAAVVLVNTLITLAGHRKWYLENPVSIISTFYRKPDQIIQPYEFGEDASKKTCLWLNGLSPLKKDPAKRFPGRIVTTPTGKQVERWSNQTDSGQNRLAPSPTRWKERSRTYAGIAHAMAEQWGS